MWFYAAGNRPRMAVSGMFLLSYGLIRIFTEFFREPDPHIGFLVYEWLTVGQLLSLPMILFGLVVLASSYRTVGNYK
mgnify:FL=1